jgi:catechol 2,3-dioxygenase-like lactoylglutathione lyase family enzyme
MDALELEKSGTPFDPREDRRPRIEEPPPVRLVAVEDCVLPAVAGLECDLDNFYVSLLGFIRDQEEGGDEIVYRAENFRLRFFVLERKTARDGYRSLGIIVPSLAALVQRLDEAKIDFVRQRGLELGSESILVYDPTGNLVEISEFRMVI